MSASSPAPAVLTPAGDMAVRTLMLSFAQHRRSEAALARQPVILGRLHVLPPDSLKSRARRETALVRAVSITESYVHRELQGRLGAQAPTPRTKLIETLYGQAEDRATGSWDEAANFYKTYVDGTKIKSFTNWESVYAIIEARNSVIHGLGRFTPRQLRRGVNTKVAPQLAALGFSLDVPQLRLNVTTSGLDASVSMLRSYLVWLDGELP